MAQQQRNEPEMKKIGQTFIAWLLVAFLMVTTIPLVVAQNSPSPQPTPAASQSNRGAVVLEHETLFVLQTQLGGSSPQERAQNMSQRLRNFAEDQTLPLEGLTVYEGDRDGIPLTAINAGSITITHIPLVMEQQNN